MKRLIALVLFAVCALASPVTPPKPPKLIVAIVIDQFRYDYLLRFRTDYNAGLARLLNHGAVFTDAHHIHFGGSLHISQRRNAVFERHHRQ